MKSLASHIQKYTTLGAQSRSQRRVCAEAIRVVLGVSVSEAQVTIQKETLYCTVPAPLKIKIREAKREILAHIRATLGTQVRDIG